ncbi:unnamed protein product [Rotaria sp. Silwood1]|nr:unnamed protein product [Rotaria sp. Silwood1]CAF1656293.1 unnamed protein product [Rotaria sp. Silwood1]
MENIIQQNPILSQSNQDSRLNRSLETSQVVAVAASINLKNLLSYQDVMNAIERDYHLHEGQEHLNIDDKDFSEGLKQIREKLNYAHRDVYYLQEKNLILENQNNFLENEFKRQLDKIVEEKNEHINRLIHIIDQTYTRSTQINNHINDEYYSSKAEELSKKFMEQNIELQHEIETFRSKLDYIVTYINQKLDQQKTTTTTTLSSLSIHQLVFETMQQTEMKLLEFKFKFISQQEENDLLKYLMEKSQNISDIEQTKLFSIIQQRSLEREIDLVRQELEITEKKTIQFEQTFDNSDEGIKFHMENLKLKCDVLHKHILTCSQRLDDINKQNLMKLTNENQILKYRHKQKIFEFYFSYDFFFNKNIELEFELLRLRERYNELIEHTNTLKYELNNAQKQLHEKEKIEPNLNVDLEKERRRADEFENDYKSLKIKYDDVCERIRIATHQLEHVQIVLEETSRRCEQLEKEKSEINAQSEYLSQNVLNVTSKYKDKLNIIKVRLEQAEHKRHEVQLRNEKFQNDRQPFDVKNDTNNVDIYYTLDGSKPDAFITLATRRSTIQYKKKPFYISRDIANIGKVTIKAIAVSRDGIRESVIVTKIFDIKIIPSDHSLSDEYENRYIYELQQERKKLMRKMQNENEQMQQKLSESMHRSTVDSLVQENPTNYTFKFSNTNKCFKTNICTNCKSTIPFNSNTCVVCETPISKEPQQRPTAQNQVSKKLIKF